ncbi:uncharacterized protein L201_002156 [Kwoniella dendrophila CBS 6074]|uniref:Uncharacterized protein n=1 Tax=Kwoniella dendrophila CBS 6074 TaxID=1295534 RepID=A0AAX4JS08_9TREE
MTNINNQLNNLSQTIHATLLSPPTQFLLISNVDKYEWIISIFNTSKSITSVWVYRQRIAELESDETSMKEAIKEGLLHVDCGTKRQVDLTSLEEIKLHILTKPDPLVLKLEKGDINDHVGRLLGATYELLSKPQPIQNGNSDANIKELKIQLSQKDAEIATLNSRLSSLKATVVRATASDVNKKKVQQSPQKQRPLPGASQLQPNQKRRKVVEDEFAGSSDDEEEDD